MNSNISIGELKNLLDDDKMFVEVEPLTDESFYIVKETLTRMGYTLDDEPNVLYQVGHILHKKNRYYLMHYKHLYLLDGNSDLILDDNDIQMFRNIVNLMLKWDLVKLKSGDTKLEGNTKSIKVLKHNEVDDWTLKTNYHNSYLEYLDSIGNR